MPDADPRAGATPAPPRTTGLGHTLKSRLFAATYRPELEAEFEQQSLVRLQHLSPLLGLTGLAGAAFGIGARVLLDHSQYTGARLMLLPLLLLMTIGIYSARSVRLYGAAATGSTALLTFIAYLGTAGMEQPLLHFLPGMVIIVLTTSFFWVNFSQWLAGVMVCYAFLLPFVQKGLSRTEWIYCGMHVVLSFCSALVAHTMMQEYRRRTFIQARRLSEMATLDALTGIHNRRHFLEIAARMGERLQHSGQPMSVLYIDIDHFKSLNDHFGHAAGDDALRALARQLEHLVRPQDLVGRLGGEEFVVALPDCPLSDAAVLTERLRAALAMIDRPDGKLSVSIGVAQHDSRRDLATTLHRADMAMLHAKENGRNAVHVAPAAD